MSNTYCVVFLFCLSSSCVPYVVSFSVFLFCLSSSCVPYVVSFSVLCFVCLRLVYHMLSVSLNCSFLIGPFVFFNVYCNMTHCIHLVVCFMLKLAITTDTMQRTLAYKVVRTTASVNYFNFNRKNIIDFLKQKTV